MTTTVLQFVILLSINIIMLTKANEAEETNRKIKKLSLAKVGTEESQQGW